jgi:hypothetical protein
MTGEAYHVARRGKAAPEAPTFRYPAVMLARLVLVLGSSFVAATLTACATGNPIVTPRRDSGVDASHDAATLDAAVVDAALDDADLLHDASTTDAGIDGGDPDTGVDAGRDAGTDAGRDAGPVVAPVVDGVVGATEWASAISATSSTVTGWAGNELTALRAMTVTGTLYLAIEGRVAGGNAMVVYVDGDPGGAHGVAVLSTLTDSTGALDDAISAGFTTPSGFAADVAWGTTALSRTLAGADDRIGFRDLSVSASDFAWIISTSASSACTAAACEMRIPTAMLGGSAGPRTIQLFARITSPDGLTSPNQTLPMDDASTPRVVTMLLEVSE